VPLTESFEQVAQAVELIANPTRTTIGAMRNIFELTVSLLQTEI
jgi:hypothetical protein